MRVELITTGTELLLGSTLNTHVRFLSDTIFPLGWRFQRQTSVPDGPFISAAFDEALSRSDVILVTGGLGPTSDDMTREIIAEHLDLPLELHEPTEKHIRRFYKKRNREFDASGRRQAMVPLGAEVLPNPLGTAPGLLLPGTDSRPHIAILPGPPAELYPMVENHLQPKLTALAGDRATTTCRTWGLLGVGESNLGDKLEPQLRALGDVEIGYCAKPAHVEVRCLGTKDQLAEADKIVQQTYPRHWFPADEQTLESVVVKELLATGRWISTAESCTGGFIAHRLTNVPGASGVLKQARVTYANEAKTQLLGVPAEIIARDGAVSESVVRAMAEGCRERADADIALAVSGVAGPGGGSPEKPVGTVWIGLAAKGHATHAQRCFFPADRETFKLRTSQKALDLARRFLLGFPLND